MLLLIEIEGRSAIPVRALPFVTQGTLSISSLVELFYDPESNVNCEGYAPVSSYCLGVDGVVKQLAPGKWNRPKQMLASLDAGTPNSIARLEILLPGAFVWRDEFRFYYDGLSRGQAEAEARGFRPAPAGEFGWADDEDCSPAEAAIIFEGLAASGDDVSARQFGLGRAATNANDEPTTPSDSSRKYNRFHCDYNLQDLLEAEQRRIGARILPKKTLAKAVAVKVGLSEATVIRRTRKPFSQRD